MQILFPLPQPLNNANLLDLHQPEKKKLVLESGAPPTVGLLCLVEGEGDPWKGNHCSKHTKTPKDRAGNTSTEVTPQSASC